MATETAFRPYDQENCQSMDLKGGTGRSFGPAKSFQVSNAPLTTPRRALGDLGNTIQPGTAKGRKGPLMKPSKLCGTSSIKGQPLLQQICSGLNNKKRATSHIKTKGKQKVKSLEDGQKEVMYPFTDKDDMLSRPNYVTTMLKTVGSLYHGCMFQPYTVTDFDLENSESSFIHFESERRPSEEQCFMDFLPFEGDLDSMTQELCSHSLPELPPVDIDSLGLDL
ncbi:uncharacterized protein [Montipora foliosa]|uniref:uncharacterized protein n=1 Tax=Montipora foliosa TaxID=591990 RepID=UPI0035F1866B